MQNNKPLISKTERGPGGGPMPAAANGRHQMVEVFMGLLSNTYEKDYGDFKRRISLYIDRLAGDLVGVSNNVIAHLSKMKSDLVLSQDEDVERMRSHLVRMTEELRRQV